MRRVVASVCSLSILLSACGVSQAPLPAPVSGDEQSSAMSEVSSVASAALVDAKAFTRPDRPVTPPEEIMKGAEGFGPGMPYKETAVAISKDISADFSTDEAANLDAMEAAYGLALSDGEKDFFSKNKFLIKPLLDTEIRPKTDGDFDREFVALFRMVAGDTDYKERRPENAVFYSSDVFLHQYSLLLVELLKEMENKEFFPAMRFLSMKLFDQADAKAKAATTDAEKKKWMDVRNYFAVPYAILANAQRAPTKDDYLDKDGNMLDPGTVLSAFKKTDTTIDTIETVSAFVKTLKLDAQSEKTVLADLETIYYASMPGIPAMFRAAYEKYAEENQVAFKVDFTQFTPRSHYTGSSLRRQYFRAMSWFIHVPFFVKSPELTEDAFAIAQLMSENPDLLSDYAHMESAINFIVGTSDDLMPVDYLRALQSAKGAKDQEAAVMDYLIKAHPPKIKNLSATYPSVGGISTEDVILLTKGMRFFSGKFIIDSYWTQNLTQGDEKPKPGYPGKLPPMASSLEVLGLLGSDYATSKIPTLDFYKDTAGQAVDKAMKDLGDENAKLTDADWQKSVYNISLWSLKGLFSWLKEHKTELPAFMQSPLWDVKTLMTASGFWTEMRHATLLYAKQSFAEKGGGGGECDDRKIPDPPKGFVEPNVRLYDRLLFLAKRTKQGLESQKFDLTNMAALDNYVTLIGDVQAFSKQELENAVWQEKIKSDTFQYGDNNEKTCVQYSLDGPSDFEKLRLLVQEMTSALPIPVEGPILPAKDRRTSLIADVHTGGDSNYDTQVLYEAIGVPSVILVAVKDANGPRIDIGFTYSHYEFTKPIGKRLTDEDWQKNFYEPTEDPNDAFEYTEMKTWPATPSWYDAILHVEK